MSTNLINLDTVGMSPADVSAVEGALIRGDLEPLTPSQRLGYYNALCQSLGLNPLTRPFDYLKLNGKLVLYANKACAEQLRVNRGISVTNITKEILQGVLVCTAHGRDKEGREDTSTAAVDLASTKGEALANLYMKCETKAKRRLTLSMGGLGMMDETEVETIPDARKVEASVAEAAAVPVAAPAPRAAQEQPSPVDNLNVDVDALAAALEEATDFQSFKSAWASVLAVQAKLVSMDMSRMIGYKRKGEMKWGAL